MFLQGFMAKHIFPYWIIADICFKYICAFSIRFRTIIYSTSSFIFNYVRTGIPTKIIAALLFITKMWLVLSKIIFFFSFYVCVYLWISVSEHTRMAYSELAVQRFPNRHAPMDVDRIGGLINLSRDTHSFPKTN